MTTFVIVVHVLVSLMLMLVVLLQPGNKGGMGAAFGGAGGSTVFGGRGANTFLAKLTAAAAAVFMITSFSLVYLSSRGSSAFDRPGAPGGTPTVPVDAPADEAPIGEPEAPADTDMADPVGDEPPAPEAPASDEPAEAIPAEEPAPAE